MNEQEVATALHMSRIPVREALARLKGEGLMQPGYGYRQQVIVYPLNVRAFEELYDVMEPLESKAVVRAAEYADAAGVAQLETAVHAQRAAAEPYRALPFLDADDQFHRTMAGLVRNPRLHREVELCQDEFYRADRATAGLRPMPDYAIPDHEEIVAALSDRDARRAWQRVQKHRRRSHDDVLRILRALALPDNSTSRL